PKMVSRRRAGAAGVLPLRLGWQVKPPTFLLALVKLPAKGLGIVPRDRIDGQTPGVRLRDLLLATSFQRKPTWIFPGHGVVLLLGHLVLAQVKRLTDNYLVLDALIVITAFLVFRRAHHEFASRDADHFQVHAVSQVDLNGLRQL